jgi:hypothetical protein
MLGSNQASIIVHLNNSVNFNRYIVFDIYSFFLSDFNDNFNWLFNESINNNRLDIRSFSRKDNWYFDLFFDWCKFLIYNDFSLSIDSWFNNSDRLFDNFFNLENVCFDYFLSYRNFDWNMNFFVLDKSRSNLDWLFNVSVNDFGNFDNKQFLLLNFNQFSTFNYLFDNIIDKYLYWNFFVDSYKLFYWNLHYFFLLNYGLSNHWNLFNLLNRTINFKIDVSDLLDFNWLVNIDDFFDDFFYNFDCWYFNNLFNYNFNNLRNLNWFFNNSWHNYYLFNNFFNLNNFWNLDKLVNNFLNFNFNFFNSFNSSWYFNDFLYNTVYNLNVLDILNVWFFNLDNFRLFNYLFLDAFDRYNMRNMNSLDNNFRYLDINSHDSILKNWDFNLFLNSFDLLNNSFNNYIPDLFNFSWDNFLYNFFNNHLNSLDLLNSLFDNHRDLDSLRNINYLVYNSLNWYQFLNVDWYFHNFFLND